MVSGFIERIILRWNDALSKGRYYLEVFLLILIHLIDLNHYQVHAGKFSAGCLEFLVFLGRSQF